ncbi:hypothetical protein B0H13DRAFT_1512620, partial [Mycena leptocephala]
STSSTWQITPTTNPRLAWGDKHGAHSHCCTTCGISLLSGEQSGFCCRPGGSKFGEVRALPPLTPEYTAFIDDPRISHLSRILNLMLSFASLETTQPFPQIDGQPGFIAIQGRVYHR